MNKFGVFQDGKGLVDWANSYGEAEGLAYKRALQSEGEFWVIEFQVGYKSKRDTTLRTEKVIH